VGIFHAEDNLHNSLKLQGKKPAVDTPGVRYRNGLFENEQQFRSTQHSAISIQPLRLLFTGRPAWLSPASIEIQPNCTP